MVTGVQTCALPISAARQRKDFAQGDAIRDRLKALGVVLEDGKDGTTWKTL
jgi:cysteinyl-tRNA synthetase